MMDAYSAAELQEALRPIASLMSKSEKAQQKLAPNTWQYVMLQSNLNALRVALALMQNDVKALANCTQADFQDAITAIGTMIGKTQTAQAKFAPGISQYTLLQNRLKALQMAETLVKAALADRA
ncbi:MAG: hypothetical protein R3D55_07375 [Chloroflexota bacterium]